MKILKFADRVEISGTRRTSDGYLVTEARVARGGNVQDYYGHEIGEGEPNQLFKVWRPEDEIFRADSLATFAHKPVTWRHPDFEVTADNWKAEAIGHIGADVVRDGEFVRVPMMIADASAIKGIEDGTREVSMGYDCELVMQPGTTPDGQAYDAFQRNIRINHCAIVPAGRAGPQCRIGDSAARTNHEGTTMAKSVTIDGKTFEVADDVAALVANGKLQDALAASAKGLADAHAALTQANARADVAEKLAKDTKAELEEMKAKQPTADAIAKLASELVDTIEVAKTVAPKVETKGKTADAIKSEVVIAAIGDAAKGKDAAYYAAAFDMLGMAKASNDPVAAAIKSAADAGSPANDAAAKANQAYDEWLTQSWKPKSAA